MKDFCEHLFIEIVTIQIILTMSTNVIKKMMGKGWNKDKPFNLIFLFTCMFLEDEVFFIHTKIFVFNCVTVPLGNHSSLLFSP